MMTSNATKVKPSLKNVWRRSSCPHFELQPPVLSSHFSSESNRRVNSAEFDFPLYPFPNAGILRLCLDNFMQLSSKMKNTRLLSFMSALALAGVLALANSGCGKKNTPRPACRPWAGQTAPRLSRWKKPASTKSRRNWIPAEIFTFISARRSGWTICPARSAHGGRPFNAIPGLQPEDSARAGKVFDIVVRLIKDSGIEDVSGVGMSSVEIEKGMYRDKMLLHHYSGKGDGFLWQLAGGEPHPLTGLDFLPADTAMAFFSDADLPLLWNVVKKEVAKADLPQAQQWLDNLPVQFNRATQIKWDAFLDSLGGEFGLVITLDPDNNLTLPLPGGAMQIPQPGLLLAVKVNDDTIFNRIDAALKSNPQVSRSNKPDFKMRTMRVPVPLVGELRPSAASSVGYLFIASDDVLIRDVLAVKSGKKSGLKSTDEFKHLVAGPARPRQPVRLCEPAVRRNDDAGAAAGHFRQCQDPAGDGQMAAIHLQQPPRVRLFRRGELSGRLFNRREQQPKLCQLGAAGAGGRGRRACRHCHPKLRESPRHLPGKCLHQQSPPD